MTELILERARGFEINTLYGAKIINLSALASRDFTPPLDDLIIAASPRSASGGGSLVEVRGEDCATLSNLLSSSGITDFTTTGLVSYSHPSLAGRGTNGLSRSTILVALTGRGMETFDLCVSFSRGEGGHFTVDEGITQVSKTKSGPFQTPKGLTTMMGIGAEQPRLYGLLSNGVIEIDIGGLSGAQFTTPKIHNAPHGLDGRIQALTYIPYNTPKGFNLQVPYVLLETGQGQKLNRIGLYSIDGGDLPVSLPEVIHLDCSGEIRKLVPTPSGRGFLALVDGGTSVSYISLTDFGYASELGRADLSPLGNLESDTDIAASLRRSSEGIVFYVATKYMVTRSLLKLSL